MSKTRRLVALAALLPAVAFAAADPRVEDFAARFEITAAADGPYLRLPLTAGVLRYSRTADLADVRVFNSAGELLPFALHVPGAERPEESAAALAVYPIEASVQQASIAGGRLEIRQRGGATTVVIEGGRAANAPQAKVAAYLLDAREIKARAVAIGLDAEFDRARLVPVTVQASRDLKQWRTLAAGEPVFRLGQGDKDNLRSTVPLARAVPLDGEYLRLTWTNSARFELRGATLKTVPTEAPTPPPPLELELGAPVAFKGREIEWTLDTPLRFAQLRIRAAAVNTLAPLTILGRPRLGEPWRAIGRGVVYRIERDGAEQIGPAIDVAAGSYVGIKLVLDETAPPFGAPPAVAVRLPPRELIFLARGAAPYSLSVGLADASRTALPLASLVPGYERDAERKFALAALGTPRVDEKRLPRSASLLFGLDTRTFVLWAVLIGAVLLLSVFAFSLLRKANRPPPGSSAEQR